MPVLGDHTSNDKTNGNADLMKEFMSSALHDGGLGSLNVSSMPLFFCFANFTRQEGEHSSVID
jgi:hypothetical protein